MRNTEYKWRVKEDSPFGDAEGDEGTRDLEKMTETRYTQLLKTSVLRTYVNKEKEKLKPRGDWSRSKIEIPSNAERLAPGKP